MSSLTALSVSIAVLGGIATWAFLGFGGGLLIWAAFIAWGCFFHCGGDTNALKNTIVGNLFGCFMAWLSAVIILAIPGANALGLPLWAGIVVGVLVFVLCMAANIKAFSVIPATVYGFAASFAFLLQTKDMLSLSNLTSVSFNNSLVVVALSMIIGALFGFASAKGGAMLGPKS